MAERFRAQGEPTKGGEIIGAGIGIAVLDGAMVKLGLLDLNNPTQLQAADTLVKIGAVAAIAGAVKLGLHFIDRRNSHE